MLDSPAVAKKQATEIAGLYKLQLEAEVERSWIPWIGRKIRKAAAKGESGLSVKPTYWFANSWKLRDEIRRQLEAAGYKVRADNYGELTIEW